MKVEVTGVKLPSTPDMDALREAVAEALEGHAYDVLAEGNRLIMSGPKTGRIYHRGRVAHQASAPGEAPASDTGRLVASGHVDPPEVNGNLVQSTVSWAVRYAVWLEKGTRKMLARPFARPAVLKLEADGQKRIKDAVDKATKS